MTCSDIGPKNAKILIVGEAPGAEEERTGQPFQGWSGKLLKQMLASAGINFDDCYVTNVMNIRPPDNNFDFFYNDAKKKKDPSPELIAGIQTLNQKIKDVNPNIVICLGAEPLRAIAHKFGISNWRGSLLDVNGRKVIATYHPAGVLRQMSWRLLCELDFRKAEKESHSAACPKPNYRISVIPNIQQVLTWFQEFKQQKAKRVAFDIETTYEDFFIRQVGLAYRGQDGIIRALSIPFLLSSAASISVTGSSVCLPGSTTTSKSYWQVPHERMVHDLLNQVFEDANIQKIGQNSIGFDQPILEKQFGYSFHNHCFDTMHAHHCAYIELPKGLDFLCTFYTNIPNYWTEKVTEDDRSNSTYNAMDCIATLEAAEGIEKELKELKTDRLYFEHVHPLAFSLTRATERGVCFDTASRDSMKTEYECRMENINRQVEEITKKKININSSKQLKELLYDELRYPVQLTKEKTVTTDEEAIKSLIRKYPDEKLLKLILDYRELSKIVSTYLDINLDSDGRFRTVFDPSGTDTGRLSSSKTIRQTGGNLQNQPLDTRHLITARKGYTFIAGDLVQAETLVVSEILTRYGDYSLRERYKNPEFDIHVWGAAGIFGCSEASVQKWQRKIGKVGNHSGNYVAGPGVLVTQGIKHNIVMPNGKFIDYAFAKQILAVRAKMIPGLRRWWDDVERQLRLTKQITTCFGRKRIFFDRVDEQTTVRAAVAFEPQSTVGDLASLIFVRLEQEYLKEFGDPEIAYPLINVHDEVDVECRDDKVKRAREIFEHVAKIPLWIASDQPLIIPIELAEGKTWRDCKGD